MLYHSQSWHEYVSYIVYTERLSETNVQRVSILKHFKPFAFFSVMGVGEWGKIVVEKVDQGKRHQPLTQEDQTLLDGTVALHLYK